MTAYLVECPGCRISFPVDRETMRVIVSDADRCRDLSCRCNQTSVIHSGRPDPAGDADWTEPEPAA